MTASERAALWAGSAYFDADTRTQTASLMQDEEALAIHFGTGRCISARPKKVWPLPTTAAAAPGNLPM